MIFGETSGSAKFGPNIKSDRVVSFSRTTPSKVSPDIEVPVSKSKLKSNKLKLTPKTKTESKELPPDYVQLPFGFGRVLQGRAVMGSSILGTSALGKGLIEKSASGKADADTTAFSEKKAKVKAKAASFKANAKPKTKKPKSSDAAKKGVIHNMTVKLPSAVGDAPIIRKKKSKLAEKRALDNENVTFTPEEERDVGKYLLDILSTPVTKKKTALETLRARVRKNAKQKSEPAPELAAEVKPKTKIKKKVKPQAEVAADVEPEIAALPAVAPKKKKSLKTKLKNQPKKLSRLAILAGAAERSPEEEEDAEIELLKAQLTAKLRAAAEEEGVEMVFDVDAALDPFKSKKVELPIAESVSASAKGRKPTAKSKAKLRKKKQSFAQTVRQEKAVDVIDENIPKARPRIVLSDQDDYVNIESPSAASNKLRSRAGVKRDKDRVIAERKLGNQYTAKVPNNPNRLDVAALASNAVDIPEREVREFRQSTTDLTRKYVDFLRKQILPHLIALDSAIDYTRALMIDGLSREDVSTDDSLLITLRWMLHRKATAFFGEELGCKMESGHFDQVISELYKADLTKASTYTSDTVGVVKRGTQSKERNKNKKSSGATLGVMASKQKRENNG